MNFPASYKQEVSYSALSKQGEDYVYTETIVHHCKEEEIDKYEALYVNTKAAELARDSELIIQQAEEEIAWVEAAKG